jgi:putative FmdB family regulatory protein
MIIITKATTRFYPPMRSAASESPMPIYEYLCEDCRKQISVFLRSISNPPPIECRFCHGQRLTRLISRITTPKSEESRLGSSGDPSALGGVDEMGEDVGSDIMDEMEPGADTPGSDADEPLGW